MVLAAGCSKDPYDDTKGGTPTILSVLGTVTDGETGILSVAGVAPTTEGGSWVVADLPEGHTGFVVKYNKLLDGASIQTEWDSCVPLSLSVNAESLPADWFTCYSPGTATVEEGASVIIYPGTDVVKGDQGSGWMANSELLPGFYVISSTVADKSGAESIINIDARVAPVLVDDTITDTTALLVWTPDAIGGTGQEIRRATVTEGVAGAFEKLADLTSDVGEFEDTGLTPSTDTTDSVYVYRLVVLGTDTLTATSQDLEILMEPTPAP
ncbi:MAG: hypothetical protein QM767_22730 [Anaeromyxobacter sp.]